jgi:hypothetical protein
LGDRKNNIHKKQKRKVNFMTIRDIGVNGLVESHLSISFVHNHKTCIQVSPDFFILG